MMLCLEVRISDEGCLIPMTSEQQWSSEECVYIYIKCIFLYLHMYLFITYAITTDKHNAL